MKIFLAVYVFVLGLAIGSFLNVLIYRLPRKIQTVKGSSFCPSCEHSLNWTDLIPVFSFLFLRGKCRYCKGKISIRYPIIELLNALCYMAAFLVFGLSVKTVALSIVSSCLITLAMIDFDFKIIPDRFNIIIAVCGLVLLIFLRDLVWYDRLIGFFAVSVPLLIAAIITGGMGEGDIKLFAACGLVLGWKSVLLSLLISSIIAAIVGIILIKTKKANRKTEIPFGPYIAAAVLISMLIGDRIINTYFSFISSLIK